MKVGRKEGKIRKGSPNLRLFFPKPEEKLDFPSQSSVSPGFKFSPHNAEEARKVISTLRSLVTQ